MAKDKEKNPVQEYLEQIKLYDTHITNALEDIKNTEDLAEKITTTLKADVVSGGGGINDRVGNAASELVDLQNELKQKVREFRRKKKEITSVIDQVTDPMQLDILQKRYVLHKSLAEITCESKCYEYRSICRIHGQALQTVGRLLGDIL